MEVEHPLGSHFQVVYRYDQLRRKGMPLPGSTISPDASIIRNTAGVVFTPASSVYMKLSWEQWMSQSYPNLQSIHFGVGGAF